MTAIYKKEMRSFFTSPTAYIVIAVFYFFAGMFFTGYCLSNDSGELYSVISSMVIITLFVVPILTMRLFSEERRQKTDQTYLTAPISVLKVTLGKIFAATTVYLICLFIFVLFALVIAAFAQPAWATIFCNLFGFLLLGLAFISISTFISALTESQIIAAIGGIGVALVIYFIESVASFIPIEAISSAISSISFVQRYSNFALGILNISDVVFFLSVTVIFILLTVFVQEKRRWS